MLQLSADPLSLRAFILYVVDTCHSFHLICLVLGYFLFIFYVMRVVLFQTCIFLQNLLPCDDFYVFNSYFFCFLISLLQRKRLDDTRNTKDHSWRRKNLPSLPKRWPSAQRGVTWLCEDIWVLIIYAQMCVCGWESERGCSAEQI